VNVQKTAAPPVAKITRRGASAGARRTKIAEKVPANGRGAGSQPTTYPSVMFVASNGGHLAQLLALRGWWSDRDRSWVCIDKPDARSQLTGERTVWAHWPTTRNIPNLIMNFGLAIKTLRRERPDVVVSTGAAVAYPFFIVARMMRIPTVFIEVYDRLDSRTLSGRLCRPISTDFLVQWPEQQALYPESVVVGPLL
jgi:UDP-N-acetylglucosamine:LPS N-acetylglucosamine transferase